MDIDRIDRASLTTAPHIVARYRPVMWEPIEGTEERIVALLCIEPAEASAEEMAAGTYLVLPQDRLRTILGRARGDAAYGMLSECARFMTSRQSRGEPIEHIRPLFRGMNLGPLYQARAYSIDQLVDAAVRTLSAFGTAGELISDGQADRPEITRRTAEFLRQIRRTFAAGDEERQRRFHVRLQREQNAPEVWVDYAAGPVVMQVASVPASANQAPPAEAELKAKILDLQIVRQEFEGNRFEPALMLNVRSLELPTDDASKRISLNAHQQIRRYAEWANLRVIEVASAGAASAELERL